MSERFDWSQLRPECGGKDEDKHFPATMIFQRLGQGIRGGALFVCPVCGRSKFFWKSAILEGVKWEWY